MGASGGGCKTSIFSSASSSSPYVTPTQTKLTERDPVKPPPCTVSVRVLRLFETSLASFSSLDMFPFFFFFFLCERSVGRAIPLILLSSVEMEKQTEGRRGGRGGGAAAPGPHQLPSLIQHSCMIERPLQARRTASFIPNPLQKKKKTFKKMKGRAAATANVDKALT